MLLSLTHFRQLSEKAVIKICTFVENAPKIYMRIRGMVWHCAFWLAVRQQLLIIRVGAK